MMEIGSCSIQTEDSARVVPESDCIIDFGFRVMYIIAMGRGAWTAVRGERSQDFRFSLSQSICTGSQTLKVRRHTWPVYK